MTKIQYKRLLPFFHRKSARQRIILFLLADGYQVADLVSMSELALKKLKLPLEISVYRDEVLAENAYDMAFVSPRGYILPHTFYYRLVRETAEKVLNQPMSQELFRKYIHTGIYLK